MANERFKVGWYRTFTIPHPGPATTTFQSLDVSQATWASDLTDGRQAHRLAANTALQASYHSSVTTMC